MNLDQYASVPTWGEYGLAALKVLVFVLLLVALWELINALTRFDDEHELFEKRNAPYAVVRVSIVLGQAFAMTPLLGVTAGGWSDVGTLLAWGVGVLVALLLVNLVVDRVVKHPGGLSAVHQSSMAAAVVKGGVLLASGLVFRSALSGTAPSIGIAVASTAVFAVLGLAGLVLAYWVLGFLGPFRRRGQQDDGSDLAAAIISAGVLVGLGLVMNTAIAGDFTGWTDGLLGFAVTFVAGFVLLVAVVWVIDLLIIRSRHMNQIVQNNEVLPAVVMSAMVVAVALGVGSVVL
ncbi:DUF350 domain-containing protein [Nakamurella flavida]|uniref:DUF350 domain-containing protein n=1 Tax=Nakamurella flavida TaxID=363630 RepID=A0A938YRJ9_9ACTN|nr:DUF350 domain-containing protein [Nakamurella flavida]MBM9478137.1 DUF350 domain-containing protein [Nakamurella flavida]MDP9778641.1 hypothetical protein [Nakamurella flavida]